ncbi:MAG: hypothetical protein RIK87_21065 [Fuerstiella sp.]
MTATITPSRNAKAVSPPTATAIDRIHIDLDEMVSRLRREIWLGGILAVGTATIASLIVLLVIDAIFQPESAWLRVGLWIPMTGVVGLVARHFLRMPLQQKCDRLAMAWTLEQKQPAIEERLTTSLQLSENSNAKRSSIIEAVAEQAHGSLAGCQEDDLRGQEVLTRTIVAGASFAVFVLSMWIWAPYLIPSLQNVLNPWSSRVLPHLNATIRPGNTVVGEGSDIRITATASRLTDALLEIIENETVIASHKMATAANDTTAEFTLTGLKHDRQYRVRAGGLYSDRYKIFVDPKPVIKSSHVHLTFPEYTQLPPQVINDPAEPIEVIHGTRIQIDVDSTVPAGESSLKFNGTSISCDEAVLVEESGLWRHSWEFTAKAGESQRGTITLVSEAGVLSKPFHADVRALPDLPPSIIIDQPALSEVIVRPDQVIQVTYHAVDDFGCGAFHMLSQKNSEPPSTINIPHDLRAEFGGELTIELNELKLTIGDQLTVWLSISDNRPDEYGGPQAIDSRKICVQIADDSIPVGRQVVQNEERTVMADLTEALDQLQEASKLTDELQADLGESDDTAKHPSAAVEKSKRLQDRIEDAEQTLRRMSVQGELATQRLFQPEIERIQKVAENEVAESRKQAGLVPLSDNSTQRRKAIAATKQSLNDAINKLEQVREDVEERGKQLELAAQLDELARQQERLAKSQKEKPRDDADVQKEQQQVADGLQEVVEQDLDARSEQFTQRAEEAAKLSEAAAELQQQQENLAKLDQVRSKEELDDQLMDMIAREQKQIANRTERLRDKADELLKLPTEDPENQQAVHEAREKLERARQETRAAEELAKQQGEQAADPQQADKAQQAADPKQADDAQQPADPKQADNAQQAADSKQADNAQQAADPKQADDAKQAADPKRADDSQQAADPKQADDAQQAAEQQKQAAKSLEEATQSLEKVCKSCKKCSNCNKSGGSSGAGGNSPRRGGAPSTPADSKQGDSKPADSKPGDAKPADSKPGDAKPGDAKPGDAKPGDAKPGDAKPGDAKQGDAKQGDSKQGDAAPGGKSGESGNPSSKQQRPDSKKLAATADKAHQTARNPTPSQTQELAQELNQLADAAAQQSGYPNRERKPQSRQAKSSNSSDASQQAGSSQPGDTSKPQGTQGNAGADQSEVAPTQLRGRSTSNWTQSRRKLKNNVLDDQDSRIPEEFRSVVKDYFEELSRLESRQDTAEKQE